MPVAAEIGKKGILGRTLMTVATLMYGAIPPFVDFNRTHLLHPDWPPHARTHMMWLVVTCSLVAAVALCHLWVRPRRSGGVNHAAILGLCVFGGFFTSAATGPLFGGALHDPDGVPPVGPIDLNVLAFGTALLLLAVGWAMARTSDAEPVEPA